MPLPAAFRLPRRKTPGDQGANWRSDTRMSYSLARQILLTLLVTDWEVRIDKTVAQACGPGPYIQDRGQSFSPYRPIKDGK